MAYATPAQLTAWLPAGKAPATEAEATRLLERASETVDTALITAVYDVDDDGLPTDADVALALQKATCAQVEYVLDTGDETGAGSQYSDVQIGSVRLARAQKGGGATATTPTLAPHASDLLRTAGLLPGVVITGWPRWV